MGQAIDSVHHNLHQLGDKVIAAVKTGNREQVDGLFQQAEQLSTQIIGNIDRTVETLEHLTKEDVEALKS